MFEKEKGVIEYKNREQFKIKRNKGVIDDKIRLAECYIAN